MPTLRLPPILAICIFLPIQSQAGTPETWFLFQGRKVPLRPVAGQAAVWYRDPVVRLPERPDAPWPVHAAGGHADNRERMEIFEVESRGAGDVERARRLDAFRAGLVRDPRIRATVPVYFNAETGGTLVCTDRIILRVARPGVLGEILRAFPVGQVETLRLPRSYRFRTDGDALALANRIAGHPGVEWAEPEFLVQVEPTRIPDDPMYGQAWHLNGAGGRGLMAHLAWDIGWGDENTVVGVFDDGGDPAGHPDLRISPKSMNWITNPPSKPPWPVPSGFPHGSACAGAIGAIGDNHIGVVGVAPGVTILAMKITNYPQSGFASGKNLGDGILYAAENGDIGSVSIIGMQSSYVGDAIRQAALTGRKGKGFLFFSSAGNGGTGTLTWPSLFEHSISVGASTSADRKADYSQWGATGKTVDFVSPSGIPTTYNSTGTLYTSSFGGTSAATPVAAGVAALILSTNPDLTRAQVLSVMRSTCDKVGGVTYGAEGTHPQYGYGRLNAFSALKKLPPYIVIEPRDTVASPGLVFSASITARGHEMAYQWQKQAEGGQWQNVSAGADRMLSLNPMLPPHVGKYRFIVRNANGADTSRIFSLGLAGVSLARSPGPGRLEACASREGGRVRIDMRVPKAGRVRFEILGPDGKRRILLDQELGAGSHALYHPYRLSGPGPHGYRLTQGSATAVGVLLPR